jgi:hypothetical protein
MAIPICYLPTRHILDGFAEWQSNNKRSRRLHSLTKREKEILAPYIVEKNDYKTRRFRHDDPVAKGLAEEGILYCPDIPRDQYGNVAYNLHDWARIHLKKQPELAGKYKNNNEQGDD